MTFSPWLGDAEAELFDRVVVPRYLAPFGELALQLLEPVEEPMLAHLGCRTGFLDASLLSSLPGVAFVGLEASTAALARARGRELPGAQPSYQLATDVPTPLTDATYTHALALHPLVPGEARQALVEELERVLAPGGQALLALPLRGSFVELWDMFREFAVAKDKPAFARALEEAEASLPTPESLVQELLDVGFEDIDLGLEQLSISFPSGRAFVEDPIANQLVFPEILSRLSMPSSEVEAAVTYVREAVSTYWSDHGFELTVHAGCASASVPE